MIELIRDDLHRFAPPPSPKAKREIYDGYADALVEVGPALLEKYEINTHARFTALMGNWAHECGRFAIIWEDMNYTSEKRIMAVFGQGVHSAAITPSEAKLLVRNAPRLADRVYGIGNPRKALELGNTDPLDGWHYRGCGIVQITGKRDHYRYAKALGIEPEQLAEPRYAIEAALLEWDEKKCSDWCDKGDFRKVRRLINGGYNGWADVVAMTNKASKIWPVELFAAPSKKRPKLVVAANTNNDGILRLGDEGEKVKKLQEALVRTGHFAGQIDGVFGQRTYAALVTFQALHGFQPTGEIPDDEPDIWGALSDASVALRDVSEQEVRASGSTTISLFDRVRRIGASLIMLPSAVIAGDTAGLAPVENAVSGLEKVQSLAGRYSEIVAWLLSPKILVPAAVIFVGWGLYRWSRAGIANRVDDAALARNLGA